MFFFFLSGVYEVWVILIFQEFLANLSRPLPAPDNITRWHPKFPVDQVPDIEPSALPAPLHVKTYQSAKDVLEDTRGKLMPKVCRSIQVANRICKHNSMPLIPLFNHGVRYTGIYEIAKMSKFIVPVCYSHKLTNI